MTAATLLSLALSLLIAAQQPNVPQSLKDQAISVAQTAIAQATQTMTSTATSLPSEKHYTLTIDSKPENCVAFRVKDDAGNYAQEYPVTVGGYWSDGVTKTNVANEIRRTDLNGKFKDCRKINRWYFEGSNLLTSTLSTEPEIPLYVKDIEVIIGNITPTSCSSLCQGYAQSVLGQTKVAAAAGLSTTAREYLLNKIQEKRKAMETSRTNISTTATTTSKLTINSMVTSLSTAIDYLNQAELALIAQ